jgi:hypothetical protein
MLISLSLKYFQTNLTSVIDVSYLRTGNLILSLNNMWDKPVRFGYDRDTLSKLNKTCLISIPRFSVLWLRSWENYTVLRDCNRLFWIAGYLSELQNGWQTRWYGWILISNTNRASCSATRLLMIKCKLGCGFLCFLLTVHLEPWKRKHSALLVSQLIKL